MAVVVPWVELSGPHMGHITKVKLQNSAGQLAIVTELEGSMTPEDIAEIIRMSRDPTHVAGDQGETEDPDPESESERWRRQCQLVEAQSTAQVGLIDAARGAAGLLCDLFGIEHGPNSQAHKMIKQVHGSVGENIEVRDRMDFELSNLRGALVRLGFVDAPEQGGEGANKYCQRLGHHIDLMKRAGVSLLRPPNAGGPELTREQRMGQLTMLQQNASRAMIELAVLDGFVSKDSTPQEAMAGAMRWSMAEDAKRKAQALRDAEVLKANAGRIEEQLRLDGAAAGAEQDAIDRLVEAAIGDDPEHAPKTANDDADAEKLAKRRSEWRGDGSDDEGTKRDQTS